MAISNSGQEYSMEEMAPYMKAMVEAGVFERPRKSQQSSGLDNHGKLIPSLVDYARRAIESLTTDPSSSVSGATLSMGMDEIGQLAKFDDVADFLNGRIPESNLSALLSRATNRPFGGVASRVSLVEALKEILPLDASGEA